MKFLWDHFELDTDRFELCGNSKVIAVEPQTLHILVYLIENRHRLVSREDLIEHIWQGRAVSDWAISAGIKSARLALGDTKTPRTHIKTIHGQGFRFIGHITNFPPTKPTSSAPTLIVVPLENLGANSEEDYFADGISEDLITDLSQVEGLQVASRNASFSIKQQRLDTAELAARFHVSHVLEGSVRRHNNALRINAQLVDAKGGRQIWAERFDGSGPDTFALQDEINAKIVNSLKLHLTTPKARRGTSSYEAYDMLLRGRSEYYLYTPPHMAKALSYFERAVAFDPAYAEAYAHQSYCRTSTFVFAWPGSDPTLEPALQIARKAVSLDENSAVSHARLGWVQGFLGQDEEAIASFERAVSLDPESADAFQAYGETMNRLGQPEKALPLLDKAFGIESFLPHSWAFTKGHSFALLKRHEEALELLLSVLERVPGFIPARVQLVRVYYEMKRYDDAKATVASIAKFAPKYSLINARRMFPYPQEQERNRLYTALETSGMPEQPMPERPMRA